MSQDFETVKILHIWQFIVKASDGVSCVQKVVCNKVVLSIRPLTPSKIFKDYPCHFYAELADLSPYSPPLSCWVEGLR